MQDQASPAASPGAPAGTGWAGLPRTIALACAIATLWLVTRPYAGVIFDSRFYMVEALRALDPARFARDLYFQFGSQGNFSLFTQLYLPLLRLFGVGATVLILTVAGQALWLFALVRLIASLLGRQAIWLSLAMTIGMLHAYPGGFGYGEGQLTARIFAEAAVMLALSLLASRPFWAAVLLGLAAALHPLMALPGIAAALVYWALGRPVRWAAMAAGAGLLAGLALAGIAPFSNLLRTVDPDWFAVIQIRSMYCLLALWPRDFWIQTAGIFAWAGAALALAAPAHRRFLAAVFLVGAGGLACAFLGGDIAHNQLVLELQPWRSLWLMQLVAHITMPLVIAAALARTSFDASRGTVLLATGLILFSSLARLSRNASAENINFTFFSLALVAAACAVIATQLLPQHRNRRTVALAFALSGLALLSLALWRWDARSPWLRYVASSEHPPRDLAQLLPAGASVYWEDGLEMLWFRMRRPSYFSCEQATGALFYRQTAMTYRYRAASFWPLRTSDFTRWDNCAILDPRPKPQRNRAGLQNLCRREPELDYVVLKAPLDGVMPKIWTAPVLFQELQGSARAVSEPFYIYGCSLVR